MLENVFLHNATVARHICWVVKDLFRGGAGLEVPGKREYLYMKADVQALLCKTRHIPDAVIRDTVPEDAAVLGRLYAQAYFELMDQLPPPRSDTMEDFERIMIGLFVKAAKEPRKDVFKWIAVCSGRPVGFLVTRVTKDGSYVGEIGVHPSYRRKGIAQALLHRFAVFLKDQNVDTVELDVNARNTSAIGLYRSCGFKKTYTWRSGED